MLQLLPLSFNCYFFEERYKSSLKPGGQIWEDQLYQPLLFARESMTAAPMGKLIKLSIRIEMGCFPVSLF